MSSYGAKHQHYVFGYTRLTNLGLAQSEHVIDPISQGSSVTVETKNYFQIGTTILKSKYVNSYKARTIYSN